MKNKFFYNILFSIILFFISYTPSFAQASCGGIYGTNLGAARSDCPARCPATDISSSCGYDPSVSFCCGVMNSSTCDCTDNSANVFFNEINPLTFSANQNDLSTPASIINRFFVFAMPLAGLLLFIMLVIGGFEMVSKAATKKSIDSGKQRIKAAIIGFLLLFVSYWIMQIVEIVFGVRIL
jgi:hypothetical protein